MKIAVIQGSSRIDKNEMLYRYTKMYAENDEVINFGCFEGETGYTYIDTALLAGLLLNSGAVDFVVTGCSSGQGMALALSSIPNVICGYVPAPMDAYLFAQIIHGNAVSLPLAEGYTFTSEENLRQTVEKLFAEPMGQGYPASEAARKLRDAEKLKKFKTDSQKDFIEFLNCVDRDIICKVLEKKNVVEYILKNGKSQETADWLSRQ